MRQDRTRHPGNQVSSIYHIIIITHNYYNENIHGNRTMND